MNYELHKQIQERNALRVDNYILRKMQAIRNNQNIKNIDDITEKEVRVILEIIEQELENEENNVIRKAIEYEYNSNKLKMFLNKNKYVERKIKFYKDLFNELNNFVCKSYHINNKFGIYYCNAYATELSEILLKKHKKQRITLSIIITKMTNVHKFYSALTKKLYRLTHNKEELDKLYNYEKVRRNHIINQLNEQSALTKVLSKNVKTLEYNANSIIDRGFFGL